MSWMHAWRGNCYIYLIVNFANFFPTMICSCYSYLDYVTVFGGGGAKALWQGGGRKVRDYLAFVFIAAPLVKR